MFTFAKNMPTFTRFMRQKNSCDPTWIEIDSQAFSSNVALIKKAIGSSQLALVIKANAYGHGLQIVGKLAQEHPLVDVLCTATIDEALELRSAGVSKPIVALYDPGTQFDAAFKDSIALGIYSKGMLERVIRAAYKHASPLSIHLKVDTGMVRLGIEPDEIRGILAQISRTPLIVEGLFTHLADKSIEDETFIHKQLNVFCSLVRGVQDAGYNPQYIHALSSGSLHHTHSYPELTMARVGAHAYGLLYHALDRQRLTTIPANSHFKPILSWKTKIIHIKKVPPGTAVGYGKSFVTSRPTTLAILPLGYAEGLPRSLSNKGTFLIKSQPVSIAGVVSMNLTTIDVTDVLGVSIGDEVTLIGPDPVVSPSKHAATVGTIALEITTAISKHITRSLSFERVFLQENDFPANQRAE